MLSNYLLSSKCKCFLLNVIWGVIAGFVAPPGPEPEGGCDSLLLGDGTEVHHLQMRKGGDHVVSNNTEINFKYGFNY